MNQLSRRLDQTCSASSRSESSTDVDRKNRILVIYNPTAGRRRRRQLDQVTEALEQIGCDVELRSTRAAGDAEAFAREARQARETGGGPDVIVAAGGDGTINEVVNGMVGASIPLAIVPLGTANVLAAEIGLPSSPRDIAAIIANGQSRPAWVGSANGRSFVLMCGAGMDADVVARVSSRLKRLIGKGAYGMAILAWLIRCPNTRYDVVIGDETFNVATVIVANGHYYGGRFVCAPDARLWHDEFHACLFEKSGRIAALLYLIGLGTGFLSRMPGYRVIPCRTLTILPAGCESDGTGNLVQSGLVQGDGDLLATLPSRIEINPARILIQTPSEVP